MGWSRPILRPRPRPKQLSGAPDRGAGILPRTPAGTTSTGDRRGEDAGNAHPLGIAGLAGDRREDHHACLRDLHGQLDDALAVRGLRAEVDPRALDPYADAVHRLAVPRQVNRQRGLAPDEQLLRADPA